jgi:hypothetical protein
MKLPVPENPDQINVITGHILLSSWLEFWAVVAHATRKHRAPICRVGRNDPSRRSDRRYRAVAVPSVARAFIVANSASVIVPLFRCSTSRVTSVHRARTPSNRRCRGHSVRTRSG